MASNCDRSPRPDIPSKGSGQKYEHSCIPNLDKAWFQYPDAMVCKKLEPSLEKQTEQMGEQNGARNKSHCADSVAKQRCKHAVLDQQRQLP
jgi:hypothetical protein